MLNIVLFLESNCKYLGALEVLITDPCVITYIYCWCNKTFKKII